MKWFQGYVWSSVLSSKLFRVIWGSQDPGYTNLPFLDFLLCINWGFLYYFNDFRWLRSASRYGLILKANTKSEPRDFRFILNSSNLLKISRVLPQFQIPDTFFKIDFDVITLRSLLGAFKIKLYLEALLNNLKPWKQSINVKKSQSSNHDLES